MPLNHQSSSLVVDQPNEIDESIFASSNVKDSQMSRAGIAHAKAKKRISEILTDHIDNY